MASMTKEDFTKKMLADRKDTIRLTDEQSAILNAAEAGANILVDACIGSGKTTILQKLCTETFNAKRVLYLTYNTLLKIEAKNRIKEREGSYITNYHSFAYKFLSEAGFKYSNEFGLRHLVYEVGKGTIKLPKFDVLLIDEYQDIEMDIANLLRCIKSANPSMQVIAVGDVCQKIYKVSYFDAIPFIQELLGTYTDLPMTTCFRLSFDHAAMLGRCWGKQIRGVNESCVVKEITFDEAFKLALDSDASDILCLGTAKSRVRLALQRALEVEKPSKFNKFTLYSSTYDGEEVPNHKGKRLNMQESAVFVTYDKCKGMERNTVFICDFVEYLWNYRSQYLPYDILRNLFCVAASRGKKAIYFITPKTDTENESKNVLLSEEVLSKPYISAEKVDLVGVADMLKRKNVEQLAYCRSLLDLTLSHESDSPIPCVGHSGYIDLSACIGIYTEASYFEKYPKDGLWGALAKRKVKVDTIASEDLKLQKAILCSVSYATKQSRYAYKVNKFIRPHTAQAIHTRLSEVLPRDAEVQVDCQFMLSNGISVAGRCDVLHDEVVYELKFVQELLTEHFLQCACYMVALKKSSGVLWNVKDNTMYRITIPDVDLFTETVTRCVLRDVNPCE